LGEGELKSELVNLAESLKIKNKVFFPGFDNNPFKYMSKCEAFVLSSAWEGMPNVLIQALLCGSKIVSTNCPHGPKEILKNGYYGKLVSVGDVDSLSKAIKKCIGEKKNKKLRKKIEREFALKTQIKKLEKLFFKKKL
jgi:glycosyltransferase involved in cell wall biosynthesis